MCGGLIGLVWWWWFRVGLCVVVVEVGGLRVVGLGLFRIGLVVVMVFRDYFYMVVVVWWWLVWVWWWFGLGLVGGGVATRPASMRRCFTTATTTLPTHPPTPSPDGRPLYLQKKFQLFLVEVISPTEVHRWQTEQLGGLPLDVEFPSFVVAHAMQHLEHLAVSRLCFCGCRQELEGGFLRTVCNLPVVPQK